MSPRELSYPKLVILNMPLINRYCGPGGEVAAVVETVPVVALVPDGVELTPVVVAVVDSVETFPVVVLAPDEVELTPAVVTAVVVSVEAFPVVVLAPVDVVLTPAVAAGVVSTVVFVVVVVTKSILNFVVRKLVFGVSDQVPHKPDCTATEDGWRLEISYLGRREIVLSV